MADAGSTEAPQSRWRRFRALPLQSVGKTLAIAVAVAFIAGLLVSTATVWLQPRQQAQVDAARQERLLASLRALPGLAPVLAGADASVLQHRLVDLATGAFVDGDPTGFDPQAAAADPATGVDLPGDVDHAEIGRRAKLAAVYVFGAAEQPDLLVLPVYGLGYQSTIHAFVILESDLRTIAALTVYDHGETAGLGSQIEEPEFQQQFRGKRAFSAAGEFAMRITTRGAAGANEVDGIAGATRSSQGVANMLRFWLGPHGYGPMLARMSQQAGR